MTITIKEVNPTEVLINELKIALNKWKAKEYVLSAYQSTNENRRARNVDRIESLISFYERNGYLTINQIKFANKLTKNAERI